MSEDTRAFELALVRLAHAERRVDHGTATRLLMRRLLADAPPLRQLLVDDAGLEPSEVEALVTLAQTEPEEQHDVTPGQIRLTVRCDSVLSRAGKLTTYIGLRPNDPQPVALLLIPPDAIRSHGLWIDALETLRASQKVEHKSLSRVLSVERGAEGIGVITRHFKGAIALRQLLDRVHRLKLSESLRIGREIAEALTALHAAGLSHRDVTPDNVLLTREGKVLLRNAGIVFTPDGIEHLDLPQGAVFGSPHAMAPECWRGDPPNPLSDIYALGTLIYEAATGVRPFEGLFPEQLHPMHLGLRPIKPHEVLDDLPSELSDLLLWLLSKDPKARPDSAKLANVIKTLESGISRSGRTSKFQAFGGQRPFET